MERNHCSYFVLWEGCTVSFERTNMLKLLLQEGNLSKGRLFWHSAYRCWDHRVRFCLQLLLKDLGYRQPAINSVSGPGRFDMSKFSLSSVPQQQGNRPQWPNLTTGVIDAIIKVIRFTKSAVCYDLLCTVMYENLEEGETTEIFNINSKYITAAEDEKWQCSTLHWPAM